MLLEDGFWRIRHQERIIPQAKDSSAQKSSLKRLPQWIKGVNYYPQEHPWNTFDTLFKAERIQADFEKIKQLNLNTLRIFIGYEDFGKAEVKPEAFINISEDNPKKRQKIIVAGYPFGKGLSDDLKFTQGIISSLKEYKDNSNEIQIDAAINPGNSGGPIVNDDGELVAVAVSGLAKDLSEGINFGIKASSVKNFLDVNKAKYSTSSLTKFSMSNKKLSDILEESTVYTFCN